MFRLDNGNLFRSPNLEDLPWLSHEFGTKLSAWPDEQHLATLRQIHSDRVLEADHAGFQGEGDALISDKPGILLAVRTADCLPILMADPQHRAVAAIHAGWRGMVQEIAPKAIAAMVRRFGTNPEDLVVAIGPGIGGCCFEVGPEVAGEFAQFFPERADLNARAKIDLVETAKRQLRRNGVTLGHLATADLCTSCDGNLFHSYRRDRERAGRMISAIGIVGA